MADEFMEMTESMRGSMSLDGDVDGLAEFYAEWAVSYDDDVAGHGYGLPATMVAVLNAALDGDPVDRSTVRVLDAGCGTGLVGQALHDGGYVDLHGIDLSDEMVAVAEGRAIYRSLEGGVDLTARIPDRLVGGADVVTVGGVFTVGHVPPSALESCARLARPGGILVVSARAAYLDETEFLDVVDAAERAGGLQELVHLEGGPYTMDSTGDFWAWRVVHSSSQ